MARAKSFYQNRRVQTQASRIRFKAIYEVSPPLIQKFFSFVKKDKNECWRWIGAKNDRGYGEFFIGRHGLYAHRVSYTWFKQEIPKSQLVCHICDVKDCVNPDHLFTGTQCDNMQDALKKGVLQIGSRHHNSRMTESDVRTIRKMYASGKYFQKEIAKRFGVCTANICSILRRKTWLHVK